MTSKVYNEADQEVVSNLALPLPEALEIAKKYRETPCRLLNNQITIVLWGTCSYVVQFMMEINIGFQAIWILYWKRFRRLSERFRYVRTVPGKDYTFITHTLLRNLMTLCANDARRSRKKNNNDYFFVVT